MRFTRGEKRDIGFMNLNVSYRNATVTVHCGLCDKIKIFYDIIKCEVKIAQSCMTLWDPMDYTVPGILQARMLEWVAFPFSRGSFQPLGRSNPGLLHCRQILYQLSHQGSLRILEWAAYLFSSGSSWPRNQTGVSCITGGFFTNRAIFCVNNLLYVITLKCFKWYVKLYLISEAKFCFKNSLTMLIAISSGEGSFSTLNLIKKTKNYNDSRMFCLIWLCCQFTRIIQKNL